MKTLFAATHINHAGFRVLSRANQGREHFATREACAKWCAEILANTTPRTLEMVWGPHYATLAPHEVECYDHGDAMQCIFEYDRAFDTVARTEGERLLLEEGYEAFRAKNNVLELGKN